LRDLTLTFVFVAVTLLTQLVLGSPIVQYYLSTSTDIHGVPSWLQSNIPQILVSLPPLVTAGLNEVTGAIIPGTCLAIRDSAVLLRLISASLLMNGRI